MPPIGSIITCPVRSDRSAVVVRRPPARAAWAIDALLSTHLIRWQHVPAILPVMRLILSLALTVLSACAQSGPLDFLNQNRPVLDAHNCYPYEGERRGRIDPAPNTGLPVGSEQDMERRV